MTDTQHADTWNRAFTETDVFHWTEPHEAIREWVERNGDGDGRSALDIGSGYGRHTLLLARCGYAVTAIDVADVCLTRTANTAAEESLPIVTLRHDMNVHPYPLADCAFNVVVAAHSIHHTTAQGLRNTIADIERVLAPDGVLFIIAPPKPLDKGTAHEYIEPDTAVPLDGPEQGVPHHYLNELTARGMLAHFQVDQLRLDASGHLFIMAHYPGRNL